MHSEGEEFESPILHQIFLFMGVGKTILTNTSYCLDVYKGCNDTDIATPAKFMEVLLSIE